MDRDTFFLSVAEALSGCQLVEQELKLYIAEALCLVRKCTGNRLPFNMSGEDYEDAPLGTLVKTFEKLSDNPSLVNSLRLFTRERNDLSHQGISRCLDYDGESDIGLTAQYASRLKSIRAEARRLRNAIRDEGSNTRAELDFGDLPGDA